MIYGLYLSATGIVTNSHKQDVIANNLANADTDGFKRSLALFEQRRIEAQVTQARGDAHPLLDMIGGGQLLSPTTVDYSQGTLQQSSNPFDTAISGDGFIGVRDENNQFRLTRASEMMIDHQGNLITAQGHKVVNQEQQPIRLEGFSQGALTIGNRGEIRSGRDQLATIGLFDVKDRESLRPVGENLLALTGDARPTPATGRLMSGMIESSNVDPTTELTRLLETQRLLEANANMIKYQDSTLQKLINEVGKIG